MNERIRELAERQGLTGPNYLISSHELEKFAELLIRECIDLAVKEEERYDSLSSVHAAYCSMSMTNFQQVLKKHFGVEE